MTIALLPAVEIQTAASPRGSVIWLHGLGADGHDFEPIVPELGLPEDLALRFVFPHAPSIPVTLNGGLVMPAWYDVRALDLGAASDRDGLEDAAGHVRRWIHREEERGIPSDRIVLAGFSQGGAVALYAGLRHPQALAGLIGLSTWLPAERSLGDVLAPANRKIPTLLCHGRADPMVPLALGAAAFDALQALGLPVSWHTYPMGHQVHPEEIAVIGEFLRRRFEERPAS